MTSEKLDRGSLVKWSFPEPYVIKEIFSVSNVPIGVSRGGHAHRACKQILILLSGQLEVSLEDTLGTRTLLLPQDGTMIEINPMTWGKQKYLSSDTKVVVMCSEYYDEEEYIRDYQEFKEIIKKTIKRF
jgi:dTDP-4-dehydrorhamnose 3,5-epimerase-like enzyme